MRDTTLKIFWTMRGFVRQSFVIPTLHVTEPDGTHYYVVEETIREEPASLWDWLKWKFSVSDRAS